MRMGNVIYYFITDIYASNYFFNNIRVQIRELIDITLSVICSRLKYNLSFSDREQSDTTRKSSHVIYILESRSTTIVYY